MRLTKGNVTIGIQTRFGPNWPGKDALQRHVGVLSAKAPLTSTMAAADFMAAYLQALGLKRAYSAFKRLILNMGDKQRISLKPIATQQRLGVGLWVS